MGRPSEDLSFTVHVGLTVSVGGIGDDICPTAVAYTGLFDNDGCTEFLDCVFDEVEELYKLLSNI
jgi:hypothetical protein